MSLEVLTTISSETSIEYYGSDQCHAKLKLSLISISFGLESIACMNVLPSVGQAYLREHHRRQET